MLAELIELSPGGVEEVELERGVVEYAIYGAPGELPELPALTAAAGGALVEIASCEVADDWQERWREFHRPLVLGGRLTVRPPWEPTASTELDLVIDPGRAFGTGAHPTTRLCLEMLLEQPAGGPFLDLGCGSGVLAVAAAKLGWAPVRAYDLDRLAVQATCENAAANEVVLAGVQRLDIRDGLPPLEGATIAANLLAPVLLEVASRLPADRPPARMIASGLLADEADGVRRAFEAAGLAEAERWSSGAWTALVLES